jgi:spore coat protein U-like protein
MRRILIVLVGVAVVSAAADSRLSGQSASATASLSISATVSKNCTITTAPVAFGAYDSVTANAAAPLDGVGTVVVTCTKGSPAKVGLGVGANAQGTTRRMGPGPNDYLTYELYQDSAHAIVWGDTAATALDIPVAPSQAPRSFSVYGRVPPTQTVAVGNYTDTVVATVNF